MTSHRLKQIIREETRRFLTEAAESPAPLSVAGNRLYVKGKKAKINIFALGTEYLDVEVLKIVTNDDKSVVLTIRAGGITKEAPIKDPLKVKEIIDTVSAGRPFKSRPTFLGSFEIIPAV